MYHGYPDIGICGIDIQADYDAVQKRWVIDLKKDHHRLKTYLEPGDSENCLEGRPRIDLGIEIAQLRKYRKNVTAGFGPIRIRVRKRPWRNNPLVTKSNKEEYHEIKH